MVFPQIHPDAAPSELWQLQSELLLLAENELGPRGANKKIYQPTFGAYGPYLCNTPNLDGAFAVLSMNAARFWPTAVYELAHETIHLLDPTVGYTNWLEEGVAVAFSLHALKHFGMAKQSVTPQSYADALMLVMELPGGPFVAPRAARSIAGALNTVTVRSLLAVVPEHPIEKLDRLVRVCVPR